MNEGIIIFARISSKRLYGKAFAKVGDQTILDRIIRKLKIDNKYKLIVATSKKEEDQQILNYCKKNNIHSFCGSLNNVLKRALECAKYYNLYRFARVCADRPLVNYNLIDKFMKIHRNEGLDLMTNVFPPTFPKGLTTEIISTKSLLNINKLATREFDREHITNFFYRNSKKFKIKNYSYPNGNYSHLSATVDEKKDLKKLDWVIKKLKINDSEENISAIINNLLSWEIQNLSSNAE